MTRAVVTWMDLDSPAESHRLDSAGCLTYGAIGEPPFATVTRLRLSQRAGYLATTSRTIGAIARDVGYDDESSFSKAFTRVYGCSPGAFRTEWSA